MTRGSPSLVTPRGTWTFDELSRDPFLLIRRSSGSKSLILSSDKSEEVVSALLVAEGAIPVIYLGEPRSVEYFPQTEGTTWVFQSSGTTGEHKEIAHTVTDIKRTLRTSESRLVTWSFLTDITKMAGFQVVLEAVARGESLVIPDRGMSIVEKIGFLNEHGVTHLSATPSQFRQTLSVPGSSSLPLRQITLGGEVADQKILDGLREAFPESRITHVYATTETGPVFAVSDGIEGFPESQLRKESNRVVVSEASEIGIVSTAKSQIYWTGDLVELRDGRFRFRGRSSDVINVGGSKVNPNYVESIILAHPDVKDCLVAGRESTVLGQLVVAKVSLHRENANIVEELRALCKSSLPKYAFPRTFTVVDQLKYSDAGKKVREF